jgi:hypothetical protein
LLILCRRFRELLAKLRISRHFPDEKLKISGPKLDFWLRRSILGNVDPVSDHPQSVVDAQAEDERGEGRPNPAAENNSEKAEKKDFCNFFFFLD